MDKLTRYLVVGGILVVIGVGLIASSTAGLPAPVSASLVVLGIVSIVLGLTMVIGALWIDLSQLRRERLGLATAPAPTPSRS